MGRFNENMRYFIAAKTANIYENVLPNEIVIKCLFMDGH